MKIIERKSADYVPENYPKKLCVLHYTGGGTLAGAEATLSIRDYVNVHYTIDVDGTIYQYLSENVWAYHTGTGKKQDRQAIGIEIVNWGHLTRKNDILYSWTGKTIPWAQVYRLPKWRGFEYWQKLTAAQYRAVRELVRAIEQRHPGIKVCTHAQLKRTKLDYHPDYPGIKALVTL